MHLDFLGCHGEPYNGHKLFLFILTFPRSPPLLSPLLLPSSMSQFTQEILYLSTFHVD